MITNPSNYAVIYARQSNLTDSNSISSQISKGKEVALKNNLLIYKTYSEKATATKTYSSNRKEFTQLILDAKAGYFKTVIVSKRDRLARCLEDFFEIKNIFQNLGINIIYSNEGEIQTGNTPASIFIENLSMIVSEFEPNIISQRTKAGRKKKRENKEYSSKPPFGFKKIDPNRANFSSSNKRIYSQYVKDEKYYKLIKNAFDIFVNNPNITDTGQILEKLKELNIDIPANFNSYKTIELLSKPTYAGLQTKSLDYKYYKFTLIDKQNNFLSIKPEYFHHCINVEPLIDSNTWFKAVEKWVNLHPKKNNKISSHKTDYLFKNLVYCSKCNKKIVLTNGIYTCKQKGCTRIKESILVPTLLKKILHDILNGESLYKFVKNKTNRLKKELQNLQKKLSKNILINEALVKDYLQKTQNESIKSQIITLEKESTEIKNNIKLVNDKINYFNNEFKEQMLSLNDPNSIKLFIDNLLSNKQMLKELLKLTVEKVYIYEYNTNIHYK